MESTQGQLALITVWASDIEFEIDTTKSPKANFAGLAKAKGWVGGDANWRLHWEACFKEPYLFGLSQLSATPTTSVAKLDLADRSRRRLSSSSDHSSGSAATDFSFISAAPSIQSLDTNGSVFGGIILGLESVVLESTETAPHLSAQTETQHPTTSATSAETHPTEDAPPAASFVASEDAQDSVKGSPFWYKYAGFVPSPRAPFKTELGRLCKHIGATTALQKRDIQVEALTAEISFHYGASMSRLDRWQELCEEVGIEKIPTSITQCQKALKPIFVNLFNLVDHRRNPDLKVIRFRSYGEFNKFTRKGHTFPRECAKQEGFIKVLLKKI